MPDSAAVNKKPSATHAVILPVFCSRSDDKGKDPVMMSGNSPESSGKST